MLIGVAGRARAGKDTVANFVTELQPKYKKYAFAEPIKEACRIIFGWDDRHLYGELKEEVDNKFGITPRYAMQTLGTEWGRDMITPEMWVLRAEREYLNTQNMIIPDVRFENEFEFIKKHRGIVFHVKRHNNNDDHDINNDEHTSEGGIEHRLRHDVDQRIYNTGSLDTLKKVVQNRIEDPLLGYDNDENE